MALYTKFFPAGDGGTLAPPCEFTLFHLLGVECGGDTDSGSAIINVSSIWCLLCAQPWNKGGSSEFGANHFHDSCHGAQLVLDLCSV